MVQMATLLASPLVMFRGLFGIGAQSIFGRIIGFLIALVFALLFFVIGLLGDACDLVVIRILQFVVVGLGAAMLTALGDSR